MFWRGVQTSSHMVATAEMPRGHHDCDNTAGSTGILQTRKPGLHGSLSHRLVPLVCTGPQDMVAYIQWSFSHMAHTSALAMLRYIKAAFRLTLLYSRNHQHIKTCSLLPVYISSHLQTRQHSCADLVQKQVIWFWKWRFWVNAYSSY